MHDVKAVTPHTVKKQVLAPYSGKAESDCAGVLFIERYPTVHCSDLGLGGTIQSGMSVAIRPSSEFLPNLKFLSIDSLLILNS
uniref:Uncharacterized protein n=1 Tax=Setaria italica TaxID=4555 RepID=K3XNU4_SETIT